MPTRRKPRRVGQPQSLWCFEYCIPCNIQCVLLPSSGWDVLRKSLRAFNLTWALSGGWGCRARATRLMSFCFLAGMGPFIGIWDSWYGWGCRFCSCLREAGTTLRGRWDCGAYAMRWQLGGNSVANRASYLQAMCASLIWESLLRSRTRASRLRHILRPYKMLGTSVRWLVSVSMGKLAQRANGLPRWLRGHGGYVLSLAPAVFTFAPLPVKISTPADDNAGWTIRSDRPTVLAAFANAPLYGGGMKIAPRAEMDDGLLDVCVVGAVDRFRLLRLFPTVYSGNHLNVPEVEYFQVPRVRVETEHPLDVYADGEFVCRTPVEVGVERAALKVVAP